MMILLWEHDSDVGHIVLWDGNSTYWTEEMNACSGNEKLLLMGTSNFG